VTAGWIICGPNPTSPDDRLLADWDGEVHPTREVADEALRDCHQKGFTDYALYALTPVEDHA
jgi:hypothetical protein